MKKILFCSSLLLFAHISARAQNVIYGEIMDNITIRFNEGSVANYFPDTSSSPLWQIGNTTKYFFSSAGSTIGIMTDTLHPYPVNANNSFIITVSNVLTSIISVWHRYQTDSLHAGGIIEFSVDSGLTRQNVQGLCNRDSTSGSACNGTYTNNFYSPHDTLFSGEPGLTGVSGNKYSRFEFYKFFACSSDCNFGSAAIYIRFRFISDATPDTLAGWMIDSIKIEHEAFESISKLSKLQSLKAFPNPSYDGAYTFPRWKRRKVSI